MDITFTPEEERFRARAREWIEANKPADPPIENDLKARRDFDLAWQNRMYEAGWAGISWPQEYGGRGAWLMEPRIWDEAFASADPDRIAGLVADDFVNEHTSALGSGSAGRDAYRDRLPGFLSSFPGLRYEVEEVVADGDRVVAAYTLTASSDGHPVRLRGVMRFVVRGGEIVRRVDYWDSLSYLRQVGQA